MYKYKLIHLNAYLYIRLIVIFCIGLIYSSQNTSVFAGPSSDNYELESYSFGSGGTTNATSENFSMFATAGEVDLGDLSSTNFKLKAGLTPLISENVPAAPTFNNPSDHYNKLRITINPGVDTTETTYAIAISTDNFATDTRYVQNTNILGSVLGAEDWQSYADWGGASGEFIIGLNPGTTYTVKVSAKRASFSQSAYGPTAQASTTNPSLTFDIDVSSNDEETTPPFSMDIGELIATTVVTAPNKVWVDLSTNGTSGGAVYVYGTNGGLLSSSVSRMISSATVNLSSVNEGYGAKSDSTNQGAGGPFQAVTPYNGGGEEVGILDSTKRVIFDTSNEPITNGRASFVIKAKASAITEAATDYTDTLTVIAATTF